MQTIINELPKKNNTTSSDPRKDGRKNQVHHVTSEEFNRLGYNAAFNKSMKAARKEKMEFYNT